MSTVKEISKATLLERMETGRQHWEEVLAEVSQERMTSSGVEGDWSVKDIIAHLTHFERGLAARLATSLAGSRPLPPEGEDTLEIDPHNALIYARNRNRPLAEVLAESQEVFQRLVAAVGALPEEDLNARAGVEKWLGFPETNGEPLWAYISGDNYEHYDDHIASIRRWLNQK